MSHCSLAVITRSLRLKEFIAITLILIFFHIFFGLSQNNGNNANLKSQFYDKVGLSKQDKQNRTSSLALEH